LRVYRQAMRLARPLVGQLLDARARRGKEDPLRLGERLGRASAIRPPGPLAWLHAVSVGESLSLLPLTQRLSQARPDLGLLITSGTRASAELLGARLPVSAIHQYAPVDTPGVARAFLDHWRPDVGLFAESELWPNLILEARDRGVRLGLVSARITARSARAWSARPAAARAVLGAFDLILAQDAASEERLTGLGARVAGRLNLKRLGAPLPADQSELERLRGRIGDRPVVAAVSTHAPEEALIAQAARSLASDVLLIIAPRHRERGEAIVADLAGRKLARRSAGAPLEADTEIYLADTLGEIGLWLRLADLAVMGGSFGEAIGGHNPLEPARLGVPLIAGPDLANFTDLYAELALAGGAILVADQAGLAAELALLMGDEPRRRRMGEAALAFAERQSGALDAALSLIGPLLPPAAP
jgi:3-deoxy-D-manno-octulosonic-acid transferase